METISVILILAKKNSRISYLYYLCVYVAVLLQLTFTNGKPKGFSVSAFDWSKSDFSRFFNLKRVKTESEFHQAWKKFIAPSLCSDTGVFSVVKAGVLADTATTMKQQVSNFA